MSGSLRLPAPPPGYSQRDQSETRRAIETFLLSERGLSGVTGGSSSTAFADLTGVPTTLAGYGITDAQGKQIQAVVSKTTASLADGATETGTITLAKVGLILLATADFASWLRLYGTSAERTADAARLITADPSVPVLGDVIFTSGALSAPAAPLVGYANRDGTPVTTIYYSLKNTSGGTHAVTFNLTHLALET